MSATVIEKTPLQQKLDEFGQQLSKVRERGLLWCKLDTSCVILVQDGGKVIKESLYT